MDDLFRTLTLSNVSGDALGTAMDILGSDWGNSSDWSGSQEHEHQHNISPFMEPDRDKSGFSPVPNLASVSEQTNITMTGGSTMTGSSGFGQGSSRQNQESACCSPVSLDMPMARQQAVQPQPLQHPVANDDQDDAASEFSRSSSSNWSHNDHLQRTVEGSNRLQLSDLIGRGAFGSVYRGLWKGRQAAIKVVEHDNGLLGECDELDVLASGMDTRSPLDTAGSSMNGNAAVMLEAALSSAVMHQNVVQTYDYQTRSSSLSGGQETFVVMEWCDRGSLESAVSDGVFHQHQPGLFEDQANMPTVCATLLDIAAGMAYLHKMHILHCDLKLRNVLLKSSQDAWRGFTVKVSDFGLSKLMPDSHAQPCDNLATDDVVGTVTHMAPELLAGGRTSPAADVYAFGILMFELWTGKAAFAGLSKVQVMVGVVSSGLRPVFPLHCPAWYSSLAAACWMQSANSRPSFAALCAQLQSEAGQGNML